MIDINLFRTERGGNPDLIRESQRKRNASVAVVDDIIALDKEWIKRTLLAYLFVVRFSADELNRKINLVQKTIADYMKAKDRATAEKYLAEKKAIESEREAVESQMKCKWNKLEELLNSIGNIVHESVPDSIDEADNALIKAWHGPEADAKPPVKGVDILSHDQVLARIDGFDAERGAKVAGHRGYFLKNWGLRLNLALIQYGLDFLSKRKYTLLQTPFMMKRDMMMHTAQLSDFDDQLFKIHGEDGEEKYLIATSEQPISAFHANEWFERPSEMLPIRYGGLSTCFRKEAGSHGKDTWGIFRVHQFEKVEQFVITTPETSWEMFDEMIGTSEAFYQSLKLPYRIVSIVSGALNNAAAKKYDLEAWFPYFGEYKELVSCSNCTDYQSRSLEIRCGMKKLGDREKIYVHLLNATLTATERTLCCIFENYQTADGLVVPEVLRSYLGGVDFIPFTAAIKAHK